MARKFLTQTDDGAMEMADSAITVGGSVALDGSNPTAIATGLSTITGFSATLQGSSAPGLGTSTLTHIVSGGNVSVYAWKPTSAVDTTLIASTGTETIRWTATGTR